MTNRSSFMRHIIIAAALLASTASASAYCLSASPIYCADGLAPVFVAPAPAQGGFAAYGATTSAPSYSSGGTPDGYGGTNYNHGRGWTGHSGTDGYGNYHSTDT